MNTETLSDGVDFESEIKIEEHQYLTFLLGEEIFAVRVLDIFEIIEYKHITKVPMMQSCLTGVTNIRGNVVPVVNLPLAFGMEESPVTNRTCIVIVETRMEDIKVHMGLTVDLVKEVYNIMPEEMEATPSFGTRVKREYIYRIGKVDGMFINILNLETILDLERLSVIKERETLM